MKTTIDKAGRLVVPKAVREATRLRPGTQVRFRVRDGRIEIEPVPLDVSLERHGSTVVAVPRDGQPALTAAEVEETTIRLRSGTRTSRRDQLAG
ncbi:MAG: AbrB/MazE/SpoVT family DNA-binding domain-containing protein [Gemmatimonadota bacterium]|nr:AbrB/MazE/SpoVT family DNA-binding domain-containing protein [Gemmatimonadota bacterium]